MKDDVLRSNIDSHFMKDFLKQKLGSLQNFIPQGKEPRSLGLDIGSRAVKWVEVEKKEDGLQLVGWKVEPYVHDEKGEALKTVLSSAQLPSAIVSAVAGKGTLIRYVELPQMSPEEVRQSFLLEIDKYFPFPQDQIYIDCFVVENQRPDKKISVLVAAAKKDVVDPRVQLFSDVGASLKMLTLNSIAIQNIFHLFPPKAKLAKEQGSSQSSETLTAYAVLDIGEAVTSLNILRGGTPLFTRDIFVGGAEMVHSISNSLAVSLDEAEKLKRAPGQQLSQVTSAMESILSQLVSEIRLSFDYFATEKNIHISEIFLVGGASAFEGLMDLFEHQFDIPVNRWKVSDTIKVAPGLDSADVERHSGELAVALGLALMG